MKLLLITGSYPPLACGVGDYSYNLAKALATVQNVSVSVLTSIGGKGITEDTGIDVLPIMKNWGIAETLKVVKTLWRISPDIVHIQYPTQGYKDGFLPWILPMLAFLFRKKVVQTWHEFHYNSLNPKLLLKAVIPGGLVVVRPEYKKNMHPKLQWILKNKKFVFIRNASAIPNITLNEEDARTLKRKYIKQQKRLIVFFGFIYEHKGTELLFDIADPEIDQIVIAGQFGDDGNYQQKIIEKSAKYPWVDKVTITGYLPVHEVAKLLAVADAVILPFRIGGGEWNTSIHGAILQKTFVLTTSRTQNGYDANNNIYFSMIDNIQEMKTALNKYAGQRRKYNHVIDRDEWLKIANDHYSLYKSLLIK